MLIINIFARARARARQVRERSRREGGVGRDVEIVGRESAEREPTYSRGEEGGKDRGKRKLSFHTYASGMREEKKSGRTSRRRRDETKARS